jgi:uncharacterized protein
MTEHTDAHVVPVDAARVQAITRPDPRLWTLYIMYCVLSNVAFPLTILPCYFRYKTLRYRFDDHGVSVSYGLLWRRETYLTYARIQDIHVTRNIFERWLGLGTVMIQTASGSAAAAESIVGLTAFQDVRNYLYARMRGHRGRSSVQTVTAGDATQHARTSGANDVAVEALTGIRDELRAVRALLEARRSGSSDV